MKIIIVGGGSAGWLTAGIIAAKYCHQCPGEDGVEITLVESPDVKTIGVGEGTWPTMRETLRKIGVSETAFFMECDASLKQGSKFCGWSHGADAYYHPFSLPQGFGDLDADISSYWATLNSQVDYAHAVSSQASVCDQALSPKQKQTPEYAGVLNYAYHLDAGKFADFLKKHCTQKLGVTYICDHVEGVENNPIGDIEHLLTRKQGKIYGDFFIDCTGFSSRLLGEHYNIPFCSKKDVLFNDSAIATQVPYHNATAAVASCTLSTAQSHGWVWDIGLPTRRGVGYTYSSSHITPDEASNALRAYVQQSSQVDEHSLPEFRHIRFNPGYRKTLWHHNCVAIGISAGFIEPLEASALVMIELAASFVRDELSPDKTVMDYAAQRFNRVFSYRWERILDFLKLHYVLSKREDSDYWRENRDQRHLSDWLTERLVLWQYRPPNRQDFDSVHEVFPAASYHYILYGMGFSTEQYRLLSPDTLRRSQHLLSSVGAMTDKMRAGLPTMREYLTGFRQ